MDGPSPIRNVSDTALWVATWRAMESERPDALFHDPYARRLGGARGEAIAARMGGPRDNWPIVVRTVQMDEIVARCVREGVRTVLNLAAGLDARPYRMDLPADLTWLHVDMPDLVGYYRAQMAGETPRCALELVAADLREEDARRTLFARVAALPHPLLVITEGLLLYLESGQVVDLSRDLHDLARADLWMADLASPVLLAWLARRRGPSQARENAPFRFGPAEGAGFFAAQGWRQREFHSTLADAFRLKRTMRFGWFWRALSLLQTRQRRRDAVRMSSVVVLERQEPSA